MAIQPVFYSFHFDNDVNRVQLVRNMGVVDGNQPVRANEWEQVKRGGDIAIKKWIHENMSRKKCVVVLVGTETGRRPWVQHEIKKAWDENRGLIGIYIHNLRCMTSGTCNKGPNPFASVQVGGQSLERLVSCYDPGHQDAYKVIAANIESWVEQAIVQATRR